MFPNKSKAHKMASQVREFVMKLGVRAILKMNAPIQAVFGAPFHDQPEQTAVLLVGNPGSESEVAFIYPPRLRSPNFVDERAELARLRGEQDRRWEKEHAEREAHVVEPQVHLVKPMEISTQFQIHDSASNWQGPVWAQRTGVLRYVRITSVPHHVIEAQQAVLDMASDVSSSHDAEHDAPFSHTDRLATPETNIDGVSDGPYIYGSLHTMTGSSSSSSPRRRGAVHRRLNPLFYREVPRKFRDQQHSQQSLLSADEQWILQYVSASESDVVGTPHY